MIVETSGRPLSFPLNRKSICLLTLMNTCFEFKVSLCAATGLTPTPVTMDAERSKAVNDHSIAFTRCLEGSRSMLFVSAQHAQATLGL